MNTYAWFYGGKEGQLEAESLYKAKLKAIEIAKPPKSKEHMVSVVLLAIKEADGSKREITHIAVD